MRMSKSCQHPNVGPDSFFGIAELYPRKAKGWAKMTDDIFTMNRVRKQSKPNLRHHRVQSFFRSTAM